jgi:hypothetical protein
MKILECGAASTVERKYPDSMVAYLDEEGFVVEPPNADMLCTPQSVASHAFYETANPFRLVEPDGTVLTENAECTATSDRAVRVTGSSFEKAATYTVKLEAATLVGYRTIVIAGVRDPLVVGQIDDYIDKVDKVIRGKIADSLGDALANRFSAFASVGLSALFVLLFAPVADRIGLKNSMIIACVVLIIGIFPGYLLAGSGLVGGFVGAAIPGTCKGVLAVPILLAASQIFPAGVRATAGGFSYNMSSSILGGMAPFVAVWLNSVTGNSFGSPRTWSSSRHKDGHKVALRVPRLVDPVRSDVILAKDSAECSRG